MTTAISVATGPFLAFPGSLERFTERDNNEGIATVPLSTNTQVVNMNPLINADMIESFDIYFDFRGSVNAYSGTITTSPWFPYFLIDKFTLPYQSGSMRAVDMDGHLLWLTTMLRGNNAKYQVTPYNQQAVIPTLYSPQPNLISTTTFPLAPSQQPVYDFNFRVTTALWFDKFYDLSTDGKNLIKYDDTYVSPFLMSSTARNVVPQMTLNPLFGATTDSALFVQGGATTTAPTWTDQGSTLTFRRNGWRQPVNANLMPPQFNWVHTWFTSRYALDTARKHITLPVEGQLLCIVGRMFDPTLNGGLGDAISIRNLDRLAVTYGSGINKFDDTPPSHQDRLARQHGFIPTDGVIIWDMYWDTRSNLDSINTYNTAAPTLRLDFGSRVPGPNSYIDLCLEYLTLVGTGM